MSRATAQPGVAAAAPIQIVAHAIAPDSSILLFGADPRGVLARRLVLISGRAPRGAELLVSLGAAKRLHTTVGQPIAVSGRQFPVAGIYRSGISLEDSGVVLPLALTQTISRRPGEISMIAVSVASGYRDVDVERRIERAIPGTVLLGDPSGVARVDTNSRVITKAAKTIAVLALLLGAVVVVNTMAMSVIERRQQFGLLTEVGWSQARAAALILGEAIAASLADATVGLALGALASELVVRALAAGTFVSPTLTACPGARPARRLRARRHRRTGLGLAGDARPRAEGDQQLATCPDKRSGHTAIWRPPGTRLAPTATEVGWVTRGARRLEIRC